MAEIDMRTFAAGTGTTLRLSAGSTVFKRGDAGDCMYVVQSGKVEMVIGERVIEVCGPNTAFGYMSLIDGAARSSTAHVREDVELSLLDARKFRFMLDEIPNFAMYIFQAMAHRIRGMGQAM